MGFEITDMHEEDVQNGKGKKKKREKKWKREESEKERHGICSEKKKE